MADIDNSLIIQDLRKEQIVRELLEKTKNGGLTWTHLGGNEFSTSFTDSDFIAWSFSLSKTQIGTLSYRYNLDIKKNSNTYLTMSDGALGSSSRDTQSKDLYEVVEMLTLGLDSRAEEALRSIQSILSAAES